MGSQQGVQQGVHPEPRYQITYDRWGEGKVAGFEGHPPSILFVARSAE
jgi:hypothetical protein